MSEDPGILMVIVERFEHVSQLPPEAYAITQCVRCDHRVWLGRKEHDSVVNGNAYQTCSECAKEVFAEAEAKGAPAQYLGMAGERPPT